MQLTLYTRPLNSPFLCFCLRTPQFHHSSQFLQCFSTFLDGPCGEKSEVLLWLHAGALFAFFSTVFSTFLNLSQPASFFLNISFFSAFSMFLNFSQRPLTAVVFRKNPTCCSAGRSILSHFSQQFFSAFLNLPRHPPFFLNQRYHPSFSQPTPFFSTSPVFSQPAPSFLTTHFSDQPPHFLSHFAFQPSLSAHTP